MTLVLALRCRDGVVLAADSQRTHGVLRESVPKLFTSPSGIVWGTAGDLAVWQEMYAAMQDLPVEPRPPRDEGRDAVVAALVQAARTATEQMQDRSETATWTDGLFAWHSRSDDRTYLLRVVGHGRFEFHRKYTAVGLRTPTELARFALSRSEHLEYGTLPLEVASMIAFSAVDDVIRASAEGVDHPVQIATVSADGADVLSPVAVRLLEDTLGAFRDHQRSYLVRREGPAPPDTGVRP
jgi:20S proteasome alpha/beta subunit